MKVQLLNREEFDKLPDLLQEQINECHHCGTHIDFGAGIYSNGHHYYHIGICFNGGVKVERAARRARKEARLRRQALLQQAQAASN